ncbi:MAG TPA: phosphoribosylformylglycinamidine synthase subunit PurL, partial [Dehalococcoidia bacterium]|nr:phosphoribosylformylglycinamidine synthase subunit PurL [Dehalococcoidia bacterium]
SEHCGYKNSKPLLRMLPSEGPQVLTSRGSENAGAIDIGDGWCVVMKIESHNHPSAIEPYEGAATGVGGIVRDIFAMGARPIAILDSLRFGPLSDGHSRYLFGGVVSGISGYGNCLGIPTVGGETYFDEAYAANPLVNAMCVGLARADGLVSATAGGAGNLLMLIGADTGRDGLHGASGLASRSDPNARFDELRPAVQVGNPFLEKMLMEACLDLAENHRDWIVGIQDLGAAGLTSAAVESAARGNSGIVLDVAKVPRREEGMTPYEVMLSESQERMLIIARDGHEGDVAALCERWEVPWALIGRVTGDGLVRIEDDGREVAVLSTEVLTEAPEYTREGRPPAELVELRALDLAALPDVTNANVALLRLLGSSNIASKRWIYRQYDQSVLTNTVVEAGADAAVLRIKGTQRGIAFSTDCNGRYCYLDPYQGAMIAVAEAARNLVCLGARPVAVTDCLNFGNPESAEVYWQLQQSVRGIADAARRLGTPVISGNVSLYNETGGHPIYPTPVIGMMGILDDVSRVLRPGSASAGDELILLGAGLEQPPATLAASEHLKLAHGLVAGQPSIDLEAEATVQGVVLEAIENGLLSAAHDCSDGGLAVALAEICLCEDVGLDASGVSLGGRLDAALFGEAQSRIVVTVRPEHAAELRALAERAGVAATALGTLTADRLRLGQALDLPLAELRNAYEGAIAEAMRGGQAVT